MIAALTRLPIARLARSPRTWITSLFWITAAITIALALHRDAAHAADRALSGAFAPVVLPLLTYAIVGATLGGTSFARACRPLVFLGAPPARVAWVTLGVAVLVAGLVSGALAAIVSFVAHGSADPPRAFDAFASAWVGAIGGAAYASLFVFGATFGPRGEGRTFALGVDFLLGAGSGFGALITPRAHVRQLLGGASAIEISPRASSIALTLIVLVFGALAVRRASSK